MKTILLILANGLTCLAGGMIVLTFADGLPTAKVCAGFLFSLSGLHFFVAGRKLENEIKKREDK